MSNVSGNWEVYVTSTHPSPGQEPKRLTQSASRDGLPAWSPDGQWLAFVTDRNGVWAVWVTRPDGTGQRKLFDLDGSLEGEVAAVPPQEQHGWTWESLVWSP
jgi:Tol biopolymer transport system component